MKLKEFLSNPVGKGDSSYSRQLLISALDNKYDNLIRNKGDLIKTHVYHKLNSDEYFIHLIIPTETERDNSYDVVLHFYPDDDSDRNHSSILNTHSIKFFCNAPSFAYSYAKVYDTNHMIEESLKHKFPDEIFRNNPDVRNRFGVTNYDKYLYFGCKYVLESRYLNRQTLLLKSVNYSKPIMDSRVRTLDRIMIDYKKAEAKLKKAVVDRAKEKIAKVTGNKIKSSNSSSDSVRQIQKKSGTSFKKVNKVKTIKKI